MTQLRRHSLAESIVNVAVGYTVAVASQHFIFPLFGYHIPLLTNMEIGVVFTVISIIRSYLLRRAFNRFTG